ncbi:MAG: hypothetical protein HC788_10315 [Sphingopyxis sp.]|nr:hypothetical protein [Sphingopyxis sp.]
MRSLRNLIHAHTALALLLVAMALCVKALVPSGYMVFAGSKTITVGLCADGMGAPKTTTITIPMDPSAPAEPAHKGKADSPCAFSTLSMAAAGGADAALVAVALAFILLLGTSFVPQFYAQNGARWHPPLRGPPVRI